MKFMIPVLLGFMFVVSGCYHNVQQEQDQDIDATLSPARDLTGTWSGTENGQTMSGIRPANIRELL